MSGNGGKREGAGRPKGSSNKSTELARTAIARFVDNNTERLQGWLDEIAQDNPEKAFACVKDLLEYHVPKLQRTEQQFLDKDGNKANPNIEVSFVKNTDTDT